MAGNGKSYAKRLFNFPFIGELTGPQARLALEKPAESAGVYYEPNAVAEILAALTRGYPYFLQEWGKHTWDIAASSPIQRSDVQRATVEALAALDESLFHAIRSHYAEGERYLRAMAELGPESHRSGDIATTLQKPVGGVAPLRQSLIDKGTIWSPAHRDTAFTVPLFDELMKRIMPSDEWKTE